MIKLDLFKEILINALSKETTQISFPSLDGNIEKLFEKECYQVLIKIKDILYAVYPSNRGGYGIQAIQTSSNTFENRKPFPEAWAGLRDKDLQAVTGVQTARFCHNARFLCTTETLEDAIKIANLAINTSN